MARYTDAVCRLCRKEGTKLFLKGERCFKDKCAIERRNFPPGQHGTARQKKVQAYGMQLREKQKLKRMFGLLERQFRGYFKKAEGAKGVTGQTLLMLLERRLDNVLHRLGFASSRAAARQVITHGHVLINGKRVDIPSYLVSANEIITLDKRGQENIHVKGAVESARGRGAMPQWLEMNWETMSGKVVSLPRREDVKYPISEHLIVELYSKV